MHKIYSESEFPITERRRKIKMSKKSNKAALESFKMEIAKEAGINLNQNYNGDLTSKQAGTIGGNMVKKMVEDYENKMK